MHQMWYWDNPGAKIKNGPLWPKKRRNSLIITQDLSKHLQSIKEPVWMRLVKEKMGYFWTKFNPKILNLSENCKSVFKWHFWTLFEWWPIFEKILPHKKNTARNCNFFKGTSTYLDEAIPKRWGSLVQSGQNGPLRPKISPASGPKLETKIKSRNWMFENAKQKKSKK